MSYLDHETGDLKYQTAIEMQELNIFTLLKPSLKKDGNQWCVLYGENLEEGVAGFGDSPADAVIDFNKAWYTSISKETPEIFKGTKEALNNLSIA